MKSYNETLLKKRGLLEYLKDEKELIKKRKTPLFDELRKMFCNTANNPNIIKAQKILDDLKIIEDEINNINKEIEKLQDELGVS